MCVTHCLIQYSIEKGNDGIEIIIIKCRFDLIELWFGGICTPKNKGKTSRIMAKYVGFILWLSFILIFPFIHFLCI